MEIAEITSDLESIFRREDVRIVFWDDPEAEFIEELPGLILQDVEVIHLHDCSTLEGRFG